MDLTSSAYLKAVAVVASAKKTKTVHPNVVDTGERLPYFSKVAN